MIQRLKKRQARVGLFCVGHKTYWDQFPGLLIRENAVELFDYGMVDDNAAARRTAAKIQADQLDLVFCNMVTYATSSVIAPIIQATDRPIVLLAMQPLKALDYTRASTRMQLENDNVCSVPEFTGVAIRLGRPISDVIIGTLYDDSQAQSEIASWCDIAKVLHDLKRARIGLMGHVLEAMYDMHTDPTAVTAAFGVHTPLLEIDDAVKIYRTIQPNEVEAKIDLIMQTFDLPDPASDPVTSKLSEADLEQSARTAVMLDKLVEHYQLTGLAYYYEGEPGTLQNTIASSLIVGNSLLIAQGVPICGEFDLKTCLAMLIMDRLNIGGSFAEFHPFDFTQDFILVGHDGPHHLAISEGRPQLRSLRKFHGKPGSGASVEFKLKEGPITMLGITQTADGRFKFVIGEGYSRQGPIPPTGNTNTRGFFEPNTRDYVKKWVMQGPTHHYALGIGHHAETIARLASVLKIEAVIVRI